MEESEGNQVEVTSECQVEADEEAKRSSKEVKPESAAKRRRQQWNTICKRAEVWKNITSPATPSFVCMYLHKDQILWTGADHMEKFINDPVVKRKFYEYSNARRVLPIKPQEATKKITLPSLNVDDYSFELLQVVLTDMVKPKSNEKNFWEKEACKPDWWPCEILFKSLYHPKDGVYLTVQQMRGVLQSFLDIKCDEYSIREDCKSGEGTLGIIESIDTKEQSNSQVWHNVTETSTEKSSSNHIYSKVCGMTKHGICQEPLLAHQKWIHCINCEMCSHLCCVGIPETCQSIVGNFSCCQKLANIDNMIIYKHPPNNECRYEACDILSIELSLHDVWSLYPSNPLTNFIVDFFVRFWNSTEQWKNSILLSPFIWSSISRNLFSEELTSKKYKRLFEIFTNTAVVIFPCCLREQWHWIAVAVFLRDKKVYTMDSLSDTENTESVIQNILSFLSPILNTNPESYSCSRLKTAHQTGVNCGVHMLFNIKALAKAVDTDPSIDDSLLLLGNDFNQNEGRKDLIHSLFTFMLSH